MTLHVKPRVFHACLFVMTSGSTFCPNQFARGMANGHAEFKWSVCNRFLDYSLQGEWCDATV